MPPTPEHGSAELDEEALCRLADVAVAATIGLREATPDDPPSTRRVLTVIDALRAARREAPGPGRAT